MKTTTLKIFPLLAVLASACALPASAAVSDIVGYVSNLAKSGSDTTISPVLQQTAITRGEILEIPATNQLKIKNASWTVDEFGIRINYVKINSGDREGVWATITGNTTDTLTVEFVVQDFGDTVGDRVVIGDTIEIIPFWTLGTFISTSNLPDGSKALFFSTSEPGSNQSATSIFTYYEGFGWYKGSNNVDGTRIFPDESFLLRLPVGANDFEMTQTGNVSNSKFRAVLDNVKASDQDIRFTTGTPVPVALGDFMNLGAAADGDKVLIFDNAEVSQNKSAISILTYYNGFGWYKGSTDANATELNPGQGFVYRKAAANANEPIVIEYKPTYQN